MVLLVVNPSHEDEHRVRGVRRPTPSTRPSRSPRRTATPRVSLPPEVIRLVIIQVTRIPDLANFALVSRYCNNIATPLLYSALSFGPVAFRRNNTHGRSRGLGGYVSTSAEFPLVRADAGPEDNFFDNRSSLCTETLSRDPHLLSYARTISTNLIVPNYAAAVRASRGQRSSEDQTFQEWVVLLSLPQASRVRHLALSGVNDQQLLILSTARHLKLTALELSVPPPALPELSHLATLFHRQRFITHFASRNLADIRGLQAHHIPRLVCIDVPAALACQLAPGRPITIARIFPVTTRRATGLSSADEVLMSIHALSQSTNPAGVVDLDVSVLWHSDNRMGGDCRAFFAAIRDSLQGLRHLRVTLWSDLTPNNVDVLFDCIMTTLPTLQSIETFEIRTWAEYGISHPSHLPHATRRAVFDLWKEMCPSLTRVAALENHTWAWQVYRASTPCIPDRQPQAVRSNSDPDNRVPLRRPLPPRPRPASGDWVRLSGRWDWQPTASPLSQTSFSDAPSTSAPPVPAPAPSGANPMSRPSSVHDPQAVGSWVQEPARQVRRENQSWRSDLSIIGSTYQRNPLDEHYVRIASSSEHLQFASRTG